jgi:hypothetical protein
MTTIPAPTFLEGHKKVLDVYGQWPSFHDGEVVSLNLNRAQAAPGPSHSVCLNLIVHGHTMTSEVLPNGYYRQINHRLVHFEFQGVSEIELEGFNHQNVLFDLHFEKCPITATDGTSFRVILNSSYGLGGEFTASSGKVISVDACDAEGNPINEL